MNEDRPSTYPYILEITHPREPGGSFRWAIRKKDKLLQRSDRRLESETKARANGEAEIERLLGGQWSSR